MIKVGESGTWIIFALVVLAAASTLLPVSEPKIPGALELAALEGPGIQATEGSLQPFCEYLSRALGLNTQPRAVRASELMLCSTLREVVPIVRLDGRPVGEGAPGPETRRLRDIYRAHVREETAAFISGHDAIE